MRSMVTPFLNISDILIIQIPNSNSRELTIAQSITARMPILLCDCGSEILIVPDIASMDKAIRAHLILHKQLTGKPITEQKLTEMILAVLT
jgi:hypothetical protein